MVHIAVGHVSSVVEVQVEVEVHVQLTSLLVHTCVVEGRRILSILHMVLLVSPSVLLVPIVLTVVGILVGSLLVIVVVVVSIVVVISETFLLATNSSIK